MTIPSPAAGFALISLLTIGLSLVLRRNLHARQRAKRRTKLYQPEVIAFLAEVRRREQQRLIERARHRQQDSSLQ